MNRRLAVSWLCSLVCAACASGPQVTTTQAPVPKGAASAPESSRAAAPPTQDYLALVASEAVDQIAVVRFGPSGIRIERTATHTTTLSKTGHAIGRVPTPVEFRRTRLQPGSYRITVWASAVANVGPPATATSPQFVIKRL